MHKGEPGEIIHADKSSFIVCCGEKSLEILELQAEGKKRMSCDAWLRGVRIENGMKFAKER